MISVPNKIIKAKPDGVGGPRWIATLDDGARVTGRPSWMGNSGPVALPNDEPDAMSDWRRLRDRCRESGIRLKALSLFCNGRWFHAPENAGAYGFFEQHAISQRGKQTGCQALAICYPLRDSRDGKLKVKVLKIHASGLYEEWWRTSWLPCMIGPPEMEQAFKDEGVLSMKAS